MLSFVNIIGGAIIKGTFKFSAGGHSEELFFSISFTGLFNGELITPASRIYLYFGQKHTPKSRTFNVLSNFTCGNGSLVVPWSGIY